MADTRVDALRRSVARLRELTAALADADLSLSAYPSEWTIADVLSHLGSGAVISRRRLDDLLAGDATPDDFAQGVWDEWNAKPPEARRTDGLTADAALLQAIEAAPAERRERFSMPLGPLTIDFDAFVGMRLNEHAVHTWDIDVALDPKAVIPADIAEVVAGNLDLITRFTAKPTGDPCTITVATPDGEHGFTVELTPEAAAVTPGAPEAPADVELDTDSLVRLVYGRLDPDHAPAVGEGPQLDILRKAFPGP